MSDYVKVGELKDFPEGRGKSVKLEGKRVAVFKLDGRLRALQDACPHMGAWLSEGRIVNGRVVCHMHDWTFDLVTGQGSFKTKAWLCARVYPVEIRGKEVYLRRPEEPRKPETEQEEEWVAWDDDTFLRPRRSDE